MRSWSGNQSVGAHVLMSDVALTAMSALGGCGGGGSSPGAVAPKQLSPAAELGEKVFRDASPAAVIDKLKLATYIGTFRQAFGADILCNVALTAPYFHNGRFATLRLALQFDVRRDTNPEEWYPPGSGGAPRKFDDLPAQYHANVNITDAPYHRAPGDAPTLSEREIDDLIAFLDTLTDGFRP